MTLAYKIILAAGFILSAFAGGFASGAWVANAKQNKASLEAMERAVIAINAIQVTNKTIHNKVVEITKTETVYKDCQHSPDAFKLILEAYK